LVEGARWAPDTKTDWPTDCRSQINFNFIERNASHYVLTASPRREDFEGNLKPQFFGGVNCYDVI
jgi:hypothetical protein